MNKEKLDSICIELNVVAVQQDANDIWMQGDLDIRINGKKPYDDSDIVMVDELLKSLHANGEYFIFSCCCGVPECSGWRRGQSKLYFMEKRKHQRNMEI